MRVNGNALKLIILILISVGFFGFSDVRSKQSKIDDMHIKFLGDSNLYLDEGAVNKLLIQNYGILKSRTQTEVALNTIEELVTANNMVKDAQVFLTIDGQLVTKIVQRKPIGRVEGVSKFYLDDTGKHMPLSKLHSARVPIITGDVTGRALEDAYVILEYINEDSFLSKNVIGIHIVSEGQYQLKFRLESFVVNLGGVENLNLKFKNFMAFYIKAAKDKTLERYATVNLEFNNQVVCTKI